MLEKRRTKSLKILVMDTLLLTKRLLDILKSIKALL
jgi:hypothetical protein